MWEVLEDLETILNKTAVDYTTIEYLVSSKLVSVKFNFEGYSILFDRDQLISIVTIKHMGSKTIDYPKYLKSFLRHKLEKIIKENDNDQF